jgi:hypothetical protein
VLVKDIPTSASNTRMIVRMVAYSAKQLLPRQYILSGIGCLTQEDEWRRVYVIVSTRPRDISNLPAFVTRW